MFHQGEVTMFPVHTAGFAIYVRRDSTGPRIDAVLSRAIEKSSIDTSPAVSS